MIYLGALIISGKFDSPPLAAQLGYIIELVLKLCAVTLIFQLITRLIRFFRRVFLVKNNKHTLEMLSGRICCLCSISIKLFLH